MCTCVCESTTHPTLPLSPPGRTEGMRKLWFFTSPFSWVSATAPPLFLNVNGDNHIHEKNHRSGPLYCSATTIISGGRTLVPRGCRCPLRHRRQPLSYDTPPPTTSCGRSCECLPGWFYLPHPARDSRKVANLSASLPHHWPRFTYQRSIRNRSQNPIYTKKLWKEDCYLSRIRFANWVRQETELFKLFLSNKVSNSKKWVSN